MEKSFTEMKEFIRKENLTIIDVVKFNATKNIQLMTLFGMFIMIFSIMVSILFSIHIINPFFAVLMLVASLGFFVMTKVEEHIQKSGEHT